MTPRSAKVLPPAVLSHTKRWRWTFGALVCVAAYALLLVTYFIDGRTGAFDGVTDNDVPSGGVLVTVDFNSIDPGTRLMTATVEVAVDQALTDPNGPIGELDVPRQPLTVLVLPTADGVPLTFPAGQPITLKQIRIPTEPGSGYIRDWPLDRYRSSLVVFAEQGSVALPIAVSFSGVVQGWHVSAQNADPAPPAAPLGLVYQVEMRRSVGVLLFGIAIVLVLVALPFLALWVVINVYRGRRKFEPAFLSWIAALLFATIPIRNFLPGSPPAGSWVDVTVVIWVIIALILALFVGVGSWWRFGRPADGESALLPEPVADHGEPAAAEEPPPLVGS